MQSDHAHASRVAHARLARMVALLQVEFAALPAGAPDYQARQVLLRAELAAHRGALIRNTQPHAA